MESFETTSSLGLASSEQPQNALMVSSALKRSERFAAVSTQPTAHPHALLAPPAPALPPTSPLLFPPTHP
jgi:hypothetical protein